jgi:hypothetical protein
VLNNTTTLKERCKYHVSLQISADRCFSRSGTTLRGRDVTHAGTCLILLEIVKLRRSWATDRCVQLSFYGQSGNGMRTQLPYSVRSLQYRKCGVFPDVASLPELLRICVNSCIQRWIFCEETYRDRPEDEQPQLPSTCCTFPPISRHQHCSD